MKISRSTKKTWFYVASSMREAYSSWDTLEEALVDMNKILAINAMPHGTHHDLLGNLLVPIPFRITGIVRTDPVVIVDTRNLIEKV